MHNISLQLDDSQFAQVEAMAKQNHKSRAEILREAIAAKVEYEAYKAVAIDEGLRSAREEPLISSEDATAHFESFRAEHG